MHSVTIDKDLDNSMTEQLPLERTIFKTKEGLKCTQRVNGKDRLRIDGKSQKMTGDVALFKGGIIKLWWHGKWWEVPSLFDFQRWTIDSCCETPDGSIVEPDDPDSWLSLANLI